MSNFYKTCSAAQVTGKEREYIAETATWVSQLFAGMPRTYVNIGVLWGCTMHCMRAGDDDAWLVGVDLDCEKVLKVELFGDHHALLTANSAECHKNFQDKTTQLLLIDGDHNHKAVEEDIKGWIPKLVDGGIVIFHDYNPTEHNLKQFPHIAGVRKAVNEWVGSVDDWEYIKSPDSLFVARKKA